MVSLVHAQAARARGDRIQATLALETTGHYSDEPGSQQYPFPLSWFYPDTANFAGFVGNLGSLRTVSRALRTFRRHASFSAEGAGISELIPGVGWADHWTFGQAHYRTIVATDTASYRYAQYHIEVETPNKVNYSRTARAVSGLARVGEQRALHRAHAGFVNAKSFKNACQSATWLGLVAR